MHLEGLSACLEYNGVQVYQTGSFDCLPKPTQTFLEPGLIQVAGMGFKRLNDPEFVISTSKHIRDGHLSVALRDDRVVAFASNRILPDIDGVYISGVVKTGDSPSGLVEAMLKDFVGQIDPGRVITRTQNDRVLEIMIGLCDTVVPIHREATPQEIDLVVQVQPLDEDQSPGLKPDLMLESGYGAALIRSGHRQRSSNPLVRRATDRLKYDEGDCLILLGYRKKVK